MKKPFNVNVNRLDPYKNYRFLVYFRDPSVTSPAVDVSKVDPILGVSKVSGLKRSSDVIEYKEGGNPVTLKGIGRTKYEPITLERGVTYDSDFEQWANAAQVLDRGHPLSSLRKLRREIQIDLLNEAGQPALRYLVHRCWVSEFQALPDLDAGGNAIAVEHIKIENEGWERDLVLTEPNEDASTGL
jgi:phage tail-like protein